MWASQMPPAGPSTSNRSSSPIRLRKYDDSVANDSRCVRNASPSPESAAGAGFVAHTASIAALRRAAYASR